MHLRHKIPWSDLVSCFRFDPTVILLPVGECGRIHLFNKATEIQVSHRKFLTPEQICTAKDCKTLPQPGSFSKNKSLPLTLTSKTRHCSEQDKKKLKYFVDKLVATVFEFVAMEEQKYRNEVIESFKPAAPIKLLDMPCLEHYTKSCQNNCKNCIVFSLFSSNQIDHLLWLDREGKVSVKDALNQYYGGQAVGNGYRFLIYYHLLPFYMTSNAIIACGYEGDEEKHGALAPDSFLRRSILHDCDFLTFIPSLRSFLEKDVFMKDMTRTMELLREIFRHIYVYIFLMKRFNFCDDSLKYEVESAVQSCFNLKF